MKDNQKQDDMNGIPNTASHDELRREIADRESQLKIKSRLIDNMAYQIRTLSNAVIGFSDLMLTETLTPSQSEYIQEIYLAGHGLSSLISEVLDWTQVLSGKIQVHKSTCKVAELLEQIDQTLSTAQQEKTLDYRIVIDPDVPESIYSDYERLFRCLLNLTATVIRYAPAGQVQIHVSTETGGDLEPFIRFDIDSDTPIAPEIIARLFEPSGFELESDQERLTMLDFGLNVTAGLPLTQQLAEFLNGTVQMQSQDGNGSSFTLRIPVGMDLGTETHDFKKPTEDNTADGILLVEDQQSNRTVITLMLESLGLDVATAADGQEAIEKASAKPYAVILMDLKMPNVDGYEATRQIRAMGIESPIVALSAKVLDRNEHRLIATLFDAYLTKPIDSGSLSGLLEKFICGFSSPGSPDTSLELETVTLEYGN